MIEPRIVIVDYGLGNLFNVRKAFETVGGANVDVSEDAAAVARADGLVIPGVGAFADGMAGLARRGLGSPIRDFVASGRRVLGICLGMQLIMSSSEEFGHHDGLGLIAGSVRSLASSAGFAGKLPHVGWDALTPARSWASTVLDGLSSSDEVYFVHSFAVVPEDPSVTLAETRYAGVDFCAVLERANVAGCQFHPEKSRATGLRILRNFVDAVATQRAASA